MAFIVKVFWGSLEVNLNKELLGHWHQMVKEMSGLQWSLSVDRLTANSLKKIPIPQSRD